MLPTLLTSILSGEATFAVRRARRAAIVYAVIGLLLVLAVGFLLAAAFIYASRYYGNLNTALGFAGGFIVLALVVWGIFKVTSSVRAKRRARRHRGELTSLATAAALAALPGLMKGRSVAGLVGLPLVALVAAQIYRENFRKGNPDDDVGDDL